MEGFFLCLTRLTTFCPLLHENKFSLPTTEQNETILVGKGEEQHFFQCGDNRQNKTNVFPSSLTVQLLD